MKFLVPIFLFFAFACSAPKSLEKCDLIITNATIVDAKKDQIRGSKWVAISEDVIVATGDMDAMPWEAAKQIDAEGQYLMPGLWDNHVHFRGGDSLIEENKALLSHFLSHGVTTIRDAGGDITTAVKSWQKKIAEGNLQGPTIFTSGPKLDGERPAWAGSIKVTNEQEVVLAFDSLESIGINYVKTYDGSLKAEQYYQIIKEAEKRGLKVTGHMPLTALLMKAVELGLDGTEHMYYLFKACSVKEDSLTAVGGGYGMMGDLLATYDEQLADSVFGVLAEKEFYVTPTLYIGKLLSTLAIDDHREDSMLQYMGPGVQNTYEGRVRTAKRNASSLSRNRNALGEKFREMMLPLYNSGTIILAGSDCGPYNSFVYPGRSLQGELFELVAAGLTPAQALACSYINGPRFMGLSEKYGEVSTGRRADLILLSRNPLEDISNVASVKKVIKDGKEIL